MPSTSGDFGPLVAPAKFGTEEPHHPALRMYKYLEDRADEDESLRILYVALTRAADYLILSAGLGADRSVHSPWLKLLADRYDLRTGLPKDDPHLASILRDQAGRTSAADHSSHDEIPEIRVHQEPPPLAKVDRSDRKRIRLSELRKLAETADSDPLPPLMHTIVPVHCGPLRLRFRDLSRTTPSSEAREVRGLKRMTTGETRWGIDDAPRRVGNPCRDARA